MYLHCSNGQDKMICQLNKIEEVFAVFELISHYKKCAVGQFNIYYNIITDEML